MICIIKHNETMGTLLISGFRLQGVFPPRVSAEKQKKRRFRRKNRIWSLSTN